MEISLLEKCGKRDLLLRQDIACMLDPLISVTYCLSEYLGLASNYLRYIQPRIFDMTNLKVLDMDDNGIQTIPTEINKSIKLEELYLSHNKITSINF
jgi:hypothetical protein